MTATPASTSHSWRRTDGVRLHCRRLARVTLTVREKFAAAHGDVRAPLSAVRREPDALAAVSGRRGLPAVCVTLDGASHDELIISTEHAEQIAEQIRTGAAHAA